MRRTHFFIAIVCVLIGILFFLFIRGIILSVFLPASIRNENSVLTTEQKKQYTANESTILFVQQKKSFEHIQRSRAWAHVWPFLIVFILVGLLFSGFIVFYRHTRPVVKISSVNDDERIITEIPIIAATVLERQLVAFAPVARNLSLAQGETQEQVIKLFTAFTGGVKAFQNGQTPTILKNTEDMPQLLSNIMQTPTPTFRQLIDNDMISPGKPLIMGYNNGIPEHRIFTDLKALGIGGWQGSGKTLSAAYLMGSAIYSCGAEGYLYDPHSEHPESLSQRIKPLIEKGFVRQIKGFDLRTTLEYLDLRISQRLNGHESCQPAIIVMFDELSRIVKASNGLSSILIEFLERCTEETRKANILFCGISPKWTARHFGGRADIRGCLNSILVHKSRLSQAKLLLEEPEEKALLKEIQKPGDGVLVTDYSKPVKVSMPFCTDADFEYLVEKMEKPQQPVITLKSKNHPCPIMDSTDITRTIRKLIADTPLRLQDVYGKLFSETEMKFETFRKKYQSPDERPWKPIERQRVSEQLPKIIEGINRNLDHKL